MRPWFLNSEVEAVVTKDVTLMALWIATRSTYDWEIEPLHRASWVEEQKGKERLWLDHLCGIVETATATVCQATGKF